MIPGVNAVVLVVFTALSVRAGKALFHGRSREDRLLDASGLLMQGVVVPFLQSVVLYTVLSRWAPTFNGALHFPSWAAFLLNFAGVDYLYYWNHRLLHAKRLWPAHAVHHTAESLDVWVTSRNTLWTPLVIVYVWLNALFAFLLAEPAPYLLAAALTAALDLWKHSDAWPARPGPVLSALGAILVTPGHHAWHHSTDRADSNFGANLVLWDRLHGTYLPPDSRPARYGIALDWSLRRRLLLA